MPLFSKESLETLRQRIDLVEVLSTHIELKPAGSSYKALCPFHDEKTPSFSIQKGDSHYHCFGCGAHGDAIQFLMGFQKMTFLEAVESLAQKFNVPLEQVETETKGPNKTKIKEALEYAGRFYHTLLLHTPEGHHALRYLYTRGIDLAFIEKFQVGLAPEKVGMLRTLMHEKKISDEILLEAGLLAKTKNDRLRDFFIDRITFPIHQPTGAIIGFSARKYKEETFGGKYINTPETALFKKSRVLFGLNYCRKQIAKMRKAIIAEGQVDTLRLIHNGFDFSVAAQGTAFGEGHAKELLTLGVNQVYLALDGDTAGKEAAYKIGNIFQSHGIAVHLVPLPDGSDPDTYLREEGPDAFQNLLDTSEEYLPFLIRYYSLSLNSDTPAGKNELIQKITKQIRAWEEPLMVHESLRKLAQLTSVPEEMIGIGTQTPNLYIKKTGHISMTEVDPNRILECDLLRWLLLIPQLLESVHAYLFPEDFRDEQCKNLFEAFLNNPSSDLLSLAIESDSPEFIAELLEKKVNKQRAETHIRETIQKILDRNWMEKREALKIKIQSGKCSDEEVMALVKQFDSLKTNPPKVEPRVKACT